MKPLLHNLVEMTGQRDHLRLEVSVLSTLLRLGGIMSVQTLDLFEAGGEPHFRPRTWREGEQWVTAQELNPSKDPARIPLAQLPSLLDGLRNHALYACHCESADRHVMWLPLWSQDKAQSCLEVVQSHLFSEHRIEVVSSIFQVYQNYQSLLEYSERDALTGLYNRKTFDEQFSRTPGLAAQDEPTGATASQPSSSNVFHVVADDSIRTDWLAVVDIDHFKQINDRFGHLYGDEVLILMANLLRESFRPRDKVFRFGGEEFVVLLRDLTLSKARKVLERFRLAVQNAHFPQVGTVTVSIGFTAVLPGSPVETLGHADQALYYAKENGRNLNAYYGDLVASGVLSTKVVSHDDIELF